MLTHQPFVSLGSVAADLFQVFGSPFQAPKAQPGLGQRVEPTRNGEFLKLAEILEAGRNHGQPANRADHNQRGNHRKRNGGAYRRL